jgi:hypothetical protein
MKTLHFLGVSALVMAFVLPGCATKPKPDERQLSERQVSELATLGTRDFGIKWEGHLVGAHERGVMAVTDGMTTLTTRAGNRIFIVHNRKEFPPTDETAFEGSDEDLKNIGMKLLLATGANKDEIAEARVLQQFTQSGETVPGSNEVKVSPPQLSFRTLMITRRIAGVDVVSSRLMLNADRNGGVAFMEMAWPDISREVLDRAMRYRELTANKFAAPPLEGAEVESVQPVVLHTPAIGFYNDATAAIRVIYSPHGEHVGQKAVLYVDENGKEVGLPRDVDRLREEPPRRREAKQ